MECHGLGTDGSVGSRGTDGPGCRRYNWTGGSDCRRFNWLPIAASIKTLRLKLVDLAAQIAGDRRESRPAAGRTTAANNCTKIKPISSPCPQIDNYQIRGDADVDQATKTDRSGRRTPRAPQTPAKRFGLISVIRSVYCFNFTGAAAAAAATAAAGAPSPLRG